MTKTNIKIGLMGAFVHNENMGCVALTYSIVQLLEELADERDVDFHYVFFEFNEDENVKKIFSQQMGILLDRLEWAPVGKFENIKVRLRNRALNKRTIKKIKECSCIIDLSLGDSFADIYGDGRFLWNVKMKETVEKYRIPLLLGPQTYGPFQKEKNKCYAKKVIEKAHTVIARDEQSADYLRSFVNKEIIVTTDLAFALPYKKKQKESQSIKKIGINISLLLVKEKEEKTPREFEIKTDYDVYVDGILEYLSQLPDIEVHIIPHVGEDGGHKYSEKYPDVITHNAFISPIEAKNTIAEMDVFIGSRMHATVAAFSSGVVTIPVGYSRKFTGLYENIGYPYVVDMQRCTTEEAIRKTKEYISAGIELNKCQRNCLKNIEEKLKLNKEIISKFIFNSDRK